MTIKPDAGVPGPSNVIKIEKGDFPWWLAVMGVLVVALAGLTVVNDAYRETFFVVLPGLTMTLVLTAVAFVIAMFLGLMIGLARISKNTFVRNAATFYIELVRGIPMLVFIFMVALVLVPDALNLISWASGGFIEIATRAVRQAWRATAALSLFYAAFIAEVFRAGIQSVPPGQREAGRAQGMTESQIMRFIVLPQAIRNMLPALGNDLIALMKDTSLVSVLAVRELTQLAKIYTGSSFRFREGYFVISVFYIVLTLLLSLMLRWYEKRIEIPGH